VRLRAGLAFAALLLSGCEGGPRVDDGARNAATTLSDGGAQPLATSTSPETTDVAAQPYSVFLQALLDGRSLASIHDEEQALISKCMSERGFSYVPVPFGVVDQSPDYTGPLQSLRQYREKFGYGITLGPASSVEDPNLASVATLSDTERAAFYAQLVGGTEAAGPDPDSCSSLAQEQVRGGLAYFDPTYAGVFDEYLSRLEADPRYIEAIERWRQCMKSSGYVVSHPDDMIAFAQSTFVGDLAGELKVASTDQDCYESTLAATRATLDAEILSLLVEEGRLPSRLLDR
jgi:hypothetical protein